MNIKAEISRRHYHPGPDFSMPVTKRKDLSVPPHWVANERIEKDGKDYAIVMPARAKELYEERQAPHMHVPASFPSIPATIEGTISGRTFIFKVKREPYEFEPVAHFDDVDAVASNIKADDFVVINL